MSLINRELERQFNIFLFNDRKLDPKRRKHTNGVVRRFLKFFKRRKFNRNNFNEFIDFLKKKGLSNGSINSYIAIAKHFDRFQKINCLQDYSYFKQERMIVDMLTTEEIKALAEIEINYYHKSDYLNKLYKNLIYFLATTGCRIEEALGLTKNDVISNPHAVIFRDTKNNEQRIVPIAPWLYKNITSLSDNNHVFISSRNSHLRADTVNYELKRRASTCGLKKHVYCHLFRHSYITEMRRQGVSITEIARLVGHKDLKSTMHYDHYVIEDLINAVYHHPLLQHQQTLEMISKRLKNTINLINKSLFQVKFEENNKQLLILIAKSS